MFPHVLLLLFFLPPLILGRADPVELSMARPRSLLGVADRTHADSELLRLDYGPSLHINASAMFKSRGKAYYVRYVPDNQTLLLSLSTENPLWATWRYVQINNHSLTKSNDPLPASRFATNWQCNRSAASPVFCDAGAGHTISLHITGNAPSPVPGPPWSVWLDLAQARGAMPMALRDQLLSVPASYGACLWIEPENAQVRRHAAGGDNFLLTPHVGVCLGLGLL